MIPWPYQVQQRMVLLTSPASRRGVAKPYHPVSANSQLYQPAVDLTVVSTDIFSCFPDEERPSDDTVRSWYNVIFARFGSRAQYTTGSYFPVLLYVCPACILRF